MPLLNTASKKLSDAIAAWIEANLTGDGQDLEGWTVHPGHSTGVRTAPKHILVIAGPESGKLVDQGMYDVLVELVVHRHAKKQPGALDETANECADAIERLAAIFSRPNNAAMKDELETIDPTLTVTGFWPEQRRDQGTDDAFEWVLPLQYHVCNTPEE